VNTGVILLNSEYCVCGSGCLYSNAQAELDDNCQKRYGGSYVSLGCTVRYSHVNQCAPTYVDFKGGYTKVVNVCTFADGDLLAVESFTAGSITKLSTRYPVKGFCKANPAIWMVGNTSVTSTSVYDTLINDGSVVIPAGQTLTLFYVVEGNSQMPLACDSGLALNPKTGKCVPAMGIIYVCSVGQFDPSLGLCAVQVNDPICTKGRLVLNPDGSYSCVWNPPVQADCDRGFYSVDEDVCKYFADMKYECESGVLHLPEQIECLSKGFEWLSCPNCPTGQLCVGGCGSTRCSEGQYCVETAIKTVTTEVINNVSVQVTNYYCEDSNAELKGAECILEVNSRLACADSSLSPVGGECITTMPSLITYSCDGTWSSDKTICYRQAPVVDNTTLITEPEGKPVVIFTGRIWRTAFFILLGLFVLALILINTKRKRR
jgi:hypothetical protein